MSVVETTRTRFDGADPVAVTRGSVIDLKDGRTLALIDVLDAAGVRIATDACKAAYTAQECSDAVSPPDGGRLLG